jgi:gliding motility-associated-like protein
LHFKKILVFIWLMTASWGQWAYGQCFDREASGEICSRATYICGKALDGYTGTLPTVNSAPQEWAALCIGGGGGSADNILWFSFRPCSNRVTLEITVNNCYIHQNSTGNNLGTHPDAGVQVGLFGECHPNRFLDCSANPTSGGGMTGTFRVTSNQFVPGELGYFYIDGYNINLNWLTICDFSIRVIEGIDTSRVNLPDPADLKPGFIYGPEEIRCQDINTSVTYQLDEPERQIAFNSACGAQPGSAPKDTLCYNWQIFPDTNARFLNDDSTGTSVDIIFEQPGDYIVTASTEFNPYLLGEGCSNAVAGNIRSWTVRVNGPDTLLSPVQYVCSGNSVSYCGQTVSQNQTLYCQTSPCEIVQQEFVFGAVSTADLGVQYVCQGESFMFQNMNYGPGIYTVLDNQDCNREITFQVDEIVLETTLQVPSTTLNCDNKEIQLTAQLNTNALSFVSYYWKDGSGNKFNEGSTTLTVNMPGTYTFTAEFSSGSSTCTTESFVVIDRDDSQPLVTVDIPLFTCRDNRTAPSALSVSSSSTFRSAQWISPLGSVQNGLSISLDSTSVVSGLPYRFVGTALNGCVVDTSFLVPSNFRTAEISMTGDDLSCYIPSTVIQVSTDITIDSIRWYKVNPNQFFGSHLSKLTHFVDQPGEYRVEVKASESKCWSEKSLFIQEDKVYPEIVPPANILWHCNTDSLTLVSSVLQSGGNFDFSWGTNDGEIITSTNQRMITITRKGTYQLNVLNTLNGCESRTSVRISDDPNVPSDIEAEVTDALCHNENNGEIFIQSAQGGYAPYDYFLNDRQVNSSVIENLSPGTYTLTVRDKYDCVFNKTITVENPPIVEVNIGEDLDMYFEQETLLTFTSNYSINDIADIAWYNREGTLLGSNEELVYIGTDKDVIELIITTVNGCQSKTRINISVDNTLEMYFPNIFSPNGDGVNDRFVLYKNKIPAQINQVVVYDRFGNKMFESQGGNFGEDFIGWDGTFNGRFVQPGVYILQIDISNFKGQREIITKDLTVIY